MPAQLPPDVPDEREHQDLERRVSLFQLVDRLPDIGAKVQAVARERKIVPSRA